MILQGKTKLIFQGVEEKVSKAGNDYALVWLADPVKFERFGLFLNDDVNLDGLNEGDTVAIQVEASVRGYSTQFNLKTVQKVNG